MRQPHRMDTWPKTMELGKTLDFPPYLFNEIQIVDTPKSLRTRMDIGSAEGWL